MNEQAIVERLESLEKKIDPIAESAISVKELKDQLAPRVNEAVKALIVELVDIEEDFQLEDLIYLSKKILRNVNNVSYAFDQLKNIIDFINAVEPLLKTTIPQIIGFFDELEQRGMLSIFTEVPSKIDFRNTKDIGVVGLLKALSDPEMRAGLGVLVELTKGLSAIKREPSCQAN